MCKAGRRALTGTSGDLPSSGRVAAGTSGEFRSSGRVVAETSSNFQSKAGRELTGNTFYFIHQVMRIKRQLGISKCWGV